MDELIEGFNAAVATLPLAQRSHIDDRTSSRIEGVWHLRDSRGTPVAKVKDHRHELPQLAAKPVRPNVATKQHVMAVAKSIINTTSKELENIRGALSEVASKVESATATKAPDTVVEVLEEIDDRLKSLESSVAERMDLIEQRGFRYVGRYQAANDFKRGDVVTHRDQLWCCVLEAKAGERPNTHCHKWTLMLSGKGADL